jgi:pimeloyl-ACP methyl ester carboxylesterase
MTMYRCTILSFLLLGLFAPTAHCAGATETAPPATQPAVDFSNTWLLHLPGIGGELRIDHDMVSGLKDGGWNGPITIYDWTEKDPGLDALGNIKRNRREAAKVAKMIEKHLEQNPNLQITITSHSGGTAIAVWALEMLPPKVNVQQLVLLASALSPQYDLSKALKHVSGKAYAFYSEGDAIVLGVGTKMFGTMDGKKTQAAGLVGFTRPPKGDRTQYARLIQRAYDKGWMVFGNIGNHIGPMSRSFAEHVLEPILSGHADAITTTTNTSTEVTTTQPAAE